MWVDIPSLQFFPLLQEGPGNFQVHDSCGHGGLVSLPYMILLCLLSSFHFTKGSASSDSGQEDILTIELIFCQGTLLEHR